MAVSAVPLYTNEAIAALPIRDPECLDREYLRYALMATSGAAQTNHAVLGAVLNKAKVEALPIPLVPLSEQRRIADLLSRAENIVRMRREAEQKAKEIIPALFLDMFGDPATNPKGWGTDYLGDLSDVQGGLQVTRARAGLPIEVPYLRVANVHRTHLDLAEIKTIRTTPAELTRTQLRANDLLVIEGHGNPAEVGRVGIWTGVVDPCTHQNHLIRVRCSPTRLEPFYVWASLNSAGGRQALLRQGKTTSGLNTISVSNVKNVSLPVPPIRLQQEFATRVGELTALQESQGFAGHGAEQTFQSLLARMFGEWRDR
jgi:type I restriction enzyme S subunit